MTFFSRFANEPNVADSASGQERSTSGDFFLVLQAYFELIRCGIALCRKDFGGLHYRVRSLKPEERPARVRTVEEVCQSIELAAIWYWRPVLCLQRSAATTLLLKRFGIPARLVIGTQLMPFKAHAWVEVDGQVVNDKPYMREIYGVLEVC